MAETTSKAILELEAKTVNYKKAGDEAHALAEEHRKLEPAAKGAASALQNEAAAIEQVGSASAETSGLAVQTAAALEGVGVAAVESSQQGSQAARQQAEAIEGVVAAAGQEREAVEAAGNASVEAARAPVGALEALAGEFRSVTNEIRASGATLLSQKEALVEYERRLADIATGYRAGGDLAKQHAEAAKQALTGVRAAINDVNTEITEQGSKYRTLDELAQQALNGIKTATNDVDVATANATNAIRKAATEMDTTGKVGARSIGFASQAVEAYKIAVEEAGTTDVATRNREIETLAKLEAELAKVTDKANRLTNASKDNAVRLKEAGNQIGGAALATQQLTSSLGPAGEKVGKFAGQIGLLAIGIEQAKDAFAALRAGGLATIGPIALVVTAIFGVTKVVGLFVEAYKHKDDIEKINIQTLKNAHEANRLIYLDHLATVGAQKQNTESANTLYAAMLSLSRIVREQGSAASMRAYSDELDKALKANTNLVGAERQRVELIIELLRRGTLLTSQQREFLKTLIDQEKYGRAANGVLNTLIAVNLKFQQATSGTRRELIDTGKALDILTKDWERNQLAIRAEIERMQQLLDADGTLTESQRRNFQARIDGLRAVDAARQQSLQLESQHAITMAKAQQEQTSAILLTRSQIQGYLVDLEAIIPKGAAYAGIAADLAGQLKSLTENSRFLADTERDRLQIIADLLAKGPALTDSQRDLALELVAAAKAGKQTSDALNIVARIQGELDIATDGTTKRTMALGQAISILTKDGWPPHSAAIGKAIAELQNAIATTHGLDIGLKKMFQSMIDGHEKISGLEGDLKNLGKQEREIVDELSRATADRARELAAEYEQIKAKIRQAQDDIASEQGRIVVTGESAKAMAEQVKASAGVVDATKKVIGVNVDGKKSIEQVAVAVSSAGSSASDAANSIDEASRTVSRAFQEWVRSGSSVEQIGEVVKSVSDVIQDKWTIAATTLGGAATRNAAELIDGLREQIAGLDELFPVFTGHIDEVTAALDRMSDASAKASGSGTPTATPSYAIPPSR